MRVATMVLAVGVTAWGAGARAQSVELVNVAPHISHVVAMTHAGDGSGRMFFVQQFGRILVHQSAATLPTPFLDLSGLVRTTGVEEGLLGLAFHPQYEANGFFFVYYTNLAGDNVVARYRVSASANVADPESGTIVLTIPHPIADQHNGGQLVFGPEGCLYIGTGDGRYSPNSQSLGTLLGKILRIRVDALPYTIPPGNPFKTTPGARPEIWAYGLRNPWRFTFDRGTGRMFIADVGADRPGEIDLQQAGVPGGANYGWDRMQGEFCHNAPFPCATPDLTLPIIDLYSTGWGCSPIGGYVYRGTAVPGIVGTYIFADFCSGDIRRARQEPSGAWAWTPAFTSSLFHYSTFGEDEAGELYVAQIIFELKGPVVDGNVYRLVAGPPPPFVAGNVTVDETPQGGVARLTSLVGSNYLPTTVDYTTVPGTASAGSDYLPVSGTLTFPPWTNFADVEIPIAVDALDEDDETFTVRFSNLQNAVMADDTAGVTVRDDDPLPYLYAFICSAVEGNVGITPCRARLTLLSESGRVVTVGYASGAGNATPGIDYQAVAGTVTFEPGVRERVVDVSVVGDTAVENDEVFNLSFGPAPAATILTPSILATIVDDDGSVAAGRELAHGSRTSGDLASGAQDLYRLTVDPYSSYEVILDQQSGDAIDARLDAVPLVGSPVFATGAPVGTGGALAMRLQNTLGSPLTNRVVRVTHPSCGAACDQQDTYRLSVRETTVRVPRFNQRSGQLSVLVLFNAASEPLTPIAYFWSESGQLLGAAAANVGPHAGWVLDLRALPQLADRSGSITIAHGAAYGALTGKLVSVDPLSGATFETAVEPRPR